MGVEINVCTVKEGEIDGKMCSVYTLVPLAPELSITAGTWGWLLNKAMELNKEEEDVIGGSFSSADEIRDALKRADHALEKMLNGKLQTGVLPWTQEIDGEIYQFAGDDRYYHYLKVFVSMCRYALENGHSVICWG